MDHLVEQVSVREQGGMGLQPCWIRMDLTPLEQSHQKSFVLLFGPEEECVCAK